jgi:hypothetical protein
VAGDWWPEMLGASRLGGEGISQGWLPCWQEGGTDVGLGVPLCCWCMYLSAPRDGQYPVLQPVPFALVCNRCGGGGVLLHVPCVHAGVSAAAKLPV